MIRTLIRSTICAAGLMLCVAAASHGQTKSFYVAINGSDSNPGTETAPFRSIRKGISVLAPGATLYIKEGTYAEAIDGGLFVIPSGTSWDSPVTIAAYPGSRVVLKPLSGSNVIGLAGSHRYIALRGLVLDASNTVFSSTAWGNGVYIGGSAAYIRIEDSEILNAPGQGIHAIGGGQFNHFVGLRIHDNGRVAQYTHGIYLESSDNLVESCEIYNNASYGITVYGHDHDPSRNVLRKNKIYNNTRIGTGSGIGIASGDRNAAYNNVIWNHNGHAIQVAWGNPSNSRVVNNTILNSYGIYIHTDSSGAVIQNNIIYGANAKVEDSGVGTVNATNLLTDPKIMNFEAMDFRLQLGSPAIDSGLSLSDISTDLDNVPRPQLNGFDIGAYEFAPTLPSAPTGVRILH